METYNDLYFRLSQLVAGMVYDPVTGPDYTDVALNFLDTMY